MHEREINKLHGAVARDGMTLVPLMIYFNSQGRAKFELALAKGRKAHDKREHIKERDWKKRSRPHHARPRLSPGSLPRRKLGSQAVLRPRRDPSFRWDDGRLTTIDWA